MSDLTAWLAGLGLAKYADAFAANEIDSAALIHLTDADLKEMGLPLGPRRKILAAIQSGATPQPSTQSPPRMDAPPTEPQADRRQVTVLFVDLVGSTDLSRSLDAEELHTLLQRFFDRVDAIVKDHGGRVDKHIGDCVMAVFGAPVAHGNDVERAVRAALAVRDAMPALSTEAGRTIQVHIGVASGQVVASGIGSGAHREYTMTGESVNLASRLTDASAADEILVSDNIWRDLTERVEGTEAGLLKLDGFASPVRAWRLQRFRTATARRPLAGRRIELEQFRAILGICRETGRGRAVYLRGEAGIGKTRLLEEFLASARERGFACHTGLVLDFGAGIGGDPLRALTCSILELTPTSSVEALTAGAAAALAKNLVTEDDRIFLNDLLGLPQPPDLRTMYEAMDNATRHARKRETLTRLIARASRAQPCVFAVEDLHWADPLTLAHLGGLAAMAANCPTILIMTSRFDGDPLDHAWRAAAGDVPLLGIDLGPLHPDEAAALAAPFIATNSATAQRCVERAGGNPLFLEQLLRHSEESAGSSVPGSVQSLVQARLDRLDPADRAVLQAASVIGQRFDRATLAHVLDQPGHAVDRLSSHFMVRPQGEEFLFAHALIHEAIYDGLLKSQRSTLHRRAAEWFATHDLTLWAAHLDRAEDSQAASAYLAAAKSQAAEYRYEVAQGLAERGLELATDRADRFALSCLLGDILHDLGAMPAALRAFERGLEAAADDRERCRAWIGCAAVKRVTDDLDGAFADLDRAEPVAMANGLKGEEARLRFLRGNLFFPRGDIAGCLREHGRSLELAREAGLAEQETAALGGLGDAEYMRGRMISSYTRLSECVELARQHGYGRTEVANRAQIAHTMLYFRPNSETIEFARAAAKSAARVGHLRAELNARLATFFALLAFDDLDACRAEIDVAKQLVERLGAWRFEQACLFTLGRVTLAAGHRAEAVDILQNAVACARRTGIGFHGPTIYGVLALAEEGADERRTALAEGEALIANGCVGHNQLRFYPDAIDVALASPDVADPERYASLLEDFTRAEPLPWADFFIARGRALAAHRKRPDSPGLREELTRLREVAARQGYRLALPPLDTALGR